MAALLPNGKQQYFDNAGLPLVGGKLYTYLVGTTTPKATYADTNGLVPNTNPVVLDARGEAVVFWRGAYRVVLKDALDNTIYTVDGVTEVSTSYSTSSNGSVVVPTGTTAQRDNPANPGYFRYNVDLNCFEGYYAASWRSFVQSFNGNIVPNGGDVLIKTVGGVSLIGAGDVPVQAPLVSGTTIKTINGISLLGAGNIAIAATTPYSTRTANTILGTADNSTIIEFTANTFTQTFTAAATLTNGWFVYLYNSGTGNITLDPNGAELIDGLTSFVMYPGECRQIICTGTGFRSIVLRPFNATFTANGTFTKPPGYTVFEGEMWPGGTGGTGGSGSLGQGVGGAGGAGRDVVEFAIPASRVGTTEAVTVGTGGPGGAGGAAGGANPGIAGTTGLASSIGTLVSTADSMSGSYYAGGAGGAGGTSGDQDGVVGISTAKGGAGGGGGGSINGGGAGPQAGSAGGTSRLAGGNGGAGGQSGILTGGPGTAGSVGTAPGGGGGGGGGGSNSNGGDGGAGGRGEVRIRGA